MSNKENKANLNNISFTNSPRPTKVLPRYSNVGGKSVISGNTNSPAPPSPCNKRKGTMPDPRRLFGSNKKPRELHDAPQYNFSLFQTAPLIMDNTDFDMSSHPADKNRISVYVRLRPLINNIRETSNNNSNNNNNAASGLAWRVRDDAYIHFIPQQESTIVPGFATPTKSSAAAMPSTPTTPSTTPSVAQQNFKFDRVFDMDSDTFEVYSCVRYIIRDALIGFNATIFAYGQTSSGKTHTMHGTADAPGIIPLAVQDIFQYIQDPATPRHYTIKASFLEIYNEKVRDLLDENASTDDYDSLDIREDEKKQVFVDGLKEQEVNSPAEVYELMHRGQQNRHVGETKMNERSSRSHTVFTLLIMSKPKDSINASLRVSQLNLVDLAGSERSESTDGLDAVRKLEGAKINTSLFMLGNVIEKLSSDGSKHIPYRDSKLTRILQNALGGNSRTCIIANISPAAANITESLSTLQFAQKAKNVKNDAQINEQLLDYKSLYLQTKAKLKREQEEGAKIWEDKVASLEAKIALLEEALESEKLNAAQSISAAEAHAQNQIREVLDLAKDEEAARLRDYESKLEAFRREYEDRIVQVQRATKEEAAARLAARELELKVAHEKEIRDLEQLYQHELELLRTQLLEDKASECNRLQQKHAEELAMLNAKHQQEMVELKSELNNQIISIAAQLEDEVQRHQHELERLRQQHTTATERSRYDFQQQQAEHARVVALLNQQSSHKIAKLKHKVAALRQQLEEETNRHAQERVAWEQERTEAEANYQNFRKRVAESARQMLQELLAEIQADDEN